MACHVRATKIIDITQWTDMHKAIAFARILLGKISGKSRPGTGPAPKANARTNLQKSSHYMISNKLVTNLTS